MHPGKRPGAGFVTIPNGVMAHLGPALRRRKRFERPWRRAAVALAVSLLANWLALSEIKVDWLAGLRPGAPAREVSLAPLSAAEWAANRSTSAPRPLALAVPKPPPPPKEAPGKVVITAPSGDDRAPDKTDFVGERNQRVEKETRSRYARTGLPNVLDRPSMPGGLQKPQVVAPRMPAPQAAQARPGKPGEPGQQPTPPGRPQQSAQERLALALDRTGDLAQHQARAAVRGPSGSPAVQGQGGERGQAGSQSGRPEIDARQAHPSAAFYEGLVGAPLDEGLRDVDQGEQTLLNTREWKYAGYLNRVKMAVAATWDPITVLFARDPTGQKFAYKDRFTLLDVTLDEKGSLQGLTVRKSCGVEFLDEAALQAFRKAQPFLNPPPGMVDTQGQIKFSFGFILEGDRPSFRVFRNY